MIHLPRNPTLLPTDFHTLSEGNYNTVMFEEEAGDQCFNTVKLFRKK